MEWMARGRSRIHAAKAKSGSILIVAVVLMVVAGFSCVSWIAFVTQSQQTANRDRDRMLAFYAAEAGVEQVVDYFNNPLTYAHSDGADDPDEYTLSSIGYGTYPGFNYRVFEPFILETKLNSNFNPVDEGDRVIGVNELNQGLRPVVYRSSFLDGTDSKVPTFDLNVEDNPRLVMRDSNGVELARVTSIQLVNPADFPDYGDATPAASEKVITKVVSTAQTPDGIIQRVELLLRDTNTLSLRAPGPLISKASIAFNGNMDVHWGEAWAKADVGIKFNGAGAVPKETADPWFALRTESWLRSIQGNNLSKYADGRVNGGFNNNTFAGPSTPNPNHAYYRPYYESTLHQQNNSLRDRENLYQHQSLDWPTLDYDDWKEFFLSNGLNYYFSDNDGQIWGKENGEWTKKSYAAWFDIAPPDPDDAAAMEEYWGAMNSLIFIDTVPTDINGNVAPVDEDGVPVRNATYKSRKPGSQGARMVTITEAGGSLHTRGAMIICANIDFRGQGNPPGPSDIKDPDDTDSTYVVSPAGNPPSGNSLSKVGHNGLLYVFGTVRWQGNRSIYGSIITDGGYQGGGTPDVWYNYRLKDSNWLNLNQSRVKRMQWSVRKSPLAEVAQEGG